MLRSYQAHMILFAMFAALPLLLCGVFGWQRRRPAALAAAFCVTWFLTYISFNQMYLNWETVAPVLGGSTQIGQNSIVNTLAEWAYAAALMYLVATLALGLREAMGRIESPYAWRSGLWFHQGIIAAIGFVVISSASVALEITHPAFQFPLQIAATSEFYELLVSIHTFYVLAWIAVCLGFRRRLRFSI